MRRIIINKGWYLTAGSRFGWETTHDPRGVGIDVEILKENIEIELEIEGDIYRVYTAQALAFARQFKSGEIHKGIKLCVVSRSILRAKYKPPPKLKKDKQNKAKDEFSPTELLQKKLF